MKLTVTKLKDYDVTKGVTKNGKPVNQFVVLDDNPFYDLLQPLNEEVSEVKQTNMLDVLFSDLPSASGESAESDDFQDFDVLNPRGHLAPKVAEFQANVSVCGVGVSDTYFNQNRTFLSTVRCPVFVYHNARNMSESQLLDFIDSELSPTDKVFHVLHIDCSQEIQGVIRKKLVSAGQSNVRLIGDKVLKLQGFAFSGLFPKTFAQHYSLEFVYLKNIHSTTQVALVSKELSKVDLSELDYKRPNKKAKSEKIATPKEKGVKKVAGTSKDSTPKPAKPKKPSRRNLF